MVANSPYFVNESDPIGDYRVKIKNQWTVYHQ